MTASFILAEAFLSFKDLGGVCAEGTHYKIHLPAGQNSTIAVDAAHGGTIKFPMSSEAAAIAGRDNALLVENGAALGAKDVHWKLDVHKFHGTEYSDLCNLSQSRVGGHLELTSTLLKLPETLAGVVREVRDILLRLAHAADGPIEPEASFC